jgi:hypothetical protein
MAVTSCRIPVAGLFEPGTHRPPIQTVLASNRVHSDAAGKAI